MLEIDSATGELANLNSLIRAPGACGEQNMIYTSPSIYVYKYKQSVGQWSAEQQRQAVNQINRGRYISVLLSLTHIILVRNT